MAKIDEGQIRFALEDSDTLMDIIDFPYINITDLDRILFYYDIIKLFVNYETSK